MTIISRDNYLKIYIFDSFFCWFFDRVWVSFLFASLLVWLACTWIDMTDLYAIVSCLVLFFSVVVVVVVAIPEATSAI